MRCWWTDLSPVDFEERVRGLYILEKYGRNVLFFPIGAHFDTVTCWSQLGGDVNGDTLLRISIHGETVTASSTRARAKVNLRRAFDQAGL